MIMTFLILIAVTIVTLIMTLVGAILPDINFSALRSGVDAFIEIQGTGLAGFKFLVGDVGITLVGYALAIYVAYYGYLIIYELVVKLFLKGQ